MSELNSSIEHVCSKLAEEQVLLRKSEEELRQTRRNLSEQQKENEEIKVGHVELLIRNILVRSHPELDGRLFNQMPWCTSCCLHVDSYVVSRGGSSPAYF